MMIKELKNEWIYVMDNDIESFEQSSETILAFEISDELLEAAASNKTAVAVAAMSFPNAPTVSILIMCCSNG